VFGDCQSLDRIYPLFPPPPENYPPRGHKKALAGNSKDHISGFIFLYFPPTSQDKEFLFWQPQSLSIPMLITPIP
jgi:hypothetical protein